MAVRAWNLAVVLVTACGTPSGGGTHDAPPPDAPPDAPFREALPPAFPQMVKQGGSVLSTPHVYPIFFTGDSTTQTEMEGFLHALPASSYWSTAVTEYGVGALTVAPSIVISDTPPTTDAALQTLLSGYLDGTHTAQGFPATIDPNDIFTVYLPVGVTLSAASNDVSCQQFYGYHYEAANAARTNYVYALLPRCSSPSNMVSTFDILTYATGHELVEASTDPYYTTAPAWSDESSTQYIWAFTPGAEVGDMCSYVDSSYQRLVGQYMVQRIWSNASESAGHDPCVPAPNPSTTPYTAAWPVLTGTTEVADIWGTSQATTPSISIPVGSAAVVDVNLFSDAPSAAWQVEAEDVAFYVGGIGSLAFQWDSQTGSNGDTLHLTITRARTGSSDGLSGTEFVINSLRNGTVVSQWWGFVTN